MYACLIFLWQFTDWTESAQYLYAPQMQTAFATTFKWTLLAPTIALMILRMLHLISSFQLTDQKERNIPYFLTVIAYLVWCNQLTTNPIPREWLLLAAGGTSALIFVAFINRFWLISAHATGVGAWMGSVLTYALAFTNIPWGMLILTAIVSIVVMAARVRLQRHSCEQVLAGWFIGLACTTLPVLIYVKTI